VTLAAIAQETITARLHNDWRGARAPSQQQQQQQQQQLSGRGTARLQTHKICDSFLVFSRYGADGSDSPR
jgi:hypothetical protein